MVAEHKLTDESVKSVLLRLFINRLLAQ